MLVIATPTLARVARTREHVMCRLASGSCLHVPLWCVLDVPAWVVRELRRSDGVRVEILREDEAA